MHITCFKISFLLIILRLAAEMLLALASAVCHDFESRETHDHNSGARALSSQDVCDIECIECTDEL
jgi:hypothetical protein